jgi:hypothetical protein
MRVLRGKSMRRFATQVLLLLSVIGALAGGKARAVTLLDQTELVGLPTVAAPSQYSFTAATAQALTLTLTDFKIPAAFTSLQVAVTLGDTLVGSAAVNSSGVATLALPAAAGDYTLYVIGTPNATQGFGGFGVCVAPAATATSCIAAYSFSGNIQTPAAASNSGTSTLNTNFTTSAVSGSYAVTITDDAFPMPLASIAGGISLGATPVTSLGAGTTQVTLAANTSYQLILAAAANAAVQAGLYGVHITDPGGAVVFDRTLPVGTMPASTVIDNTSQQALSLSLTDYAYPAALANVGVAVTEGGSAALATLTAPGSVNNFTAPAGSVEIWQFAVAGAQPGVYGVALSPYPSTAATVDLYSTTKVVDPAASNATSYAFIANLPSSGSYHLVVSDFGFPYVFPSLGTPTVAQNGVVLTVSANGDFTAAAGPVVILVNVTPPQSGDGIFGVTVETSGASPQILLDQTQAVGGAFSTNVIDVGTSGSFGVTLTDLEFPANFQYLAVVVSQGSQVLGKIYTGGTFTFNATPGQYVLTFITTPTTTNTTPSLNNYGLYSVQVAPAMPTVTFTAASSSVTSGQTDQLTWSSENATACTAGGATGWVGNEPTSGTTAVVISSTVSLTLTCSGPGGAASQSLNVTANPAPAASHGGGGSVDFGMLAALCALLLVGRGQAARRTDLS